MMPVCSGGSFVNMVAPRGLERGTNGFSVMLPAELGASPATPLSATAKRTIEQKYGATVLKTDRRVRDPKAGVTRYKTQLSHGTRVKASMTPARLDH